MSNLMHRLDSNVNNVVVYDNNVLLTTIINIDN